MVSFDDLIPQQVNGQAIYKPKSQDAFSTVTDQALQGATFGLGNRAQAGLAALALTAMNDKSLSENYKQAREVKQEQMQQQVEDNPALAIGANVAGALATGGLGATTKTGAALGNSLRGGAILGKELGTTGRIIKGAAAGSAFGAASGAGTAGYNQSLSGAGEGAIFGAVAGGAIPAVGAMGGKLIEKVTPAASEGLQEVGRLAQKFNIPVSLNQISDSRTLKNLQKVSQEIPLSGQEAFKESQMKAFNKALFKTVGVDADRFTPENMAFAFKKVGSEFDNLTKGKQFNIGGTFIDDLATTADDVASTYGNDAASIYQKEALKVINDFGNKDIISGDLISRQRARINALARKAQDPNIKGALLDLENNIVDGITSNDSALQSALSTAKQRYKNLIVLEPIANRAKGGMISPSSLNNRVSQVYRRAHTVGKSGDIGELARIGNELLPELGGSDTTQKMAYLASIAAGVTNPATAIPIVSGAITNRAIQSGINRNQALINAALNNASKTNLPSKIQPILPQLSAPAGATTGALVAPRNNNTPAVTPQQPATIDFNDLIPVAPQSNAIQGDVMSRIAQVESGGNPNARNPNSTASGLFQFTNDTWNASVQRWGKELGIKQGDKMNPQAQEAMARKLAESNAQYIQKNLGIQPDDGQIYLAHFMGAPAAVKLMRNYGKGASAAQIFPKEARANQRIFFDANGKARTIEQVYDIVTSKVRIA